MFPFSPELQKSHEECVKLGNKTLAYAEEASKLVKEHRRILEKRFAEQEAEKAKSGCFFWRKNKVAAVPQSINERALTLSLAK